MKNKTQEFSFSSHPSYSPINMTLLYNNASNTSTANATTDVPEKDFVSWATFLIITSILFLTISVIGITGNSLVIYVMLSNRKMRTVINFLLLNLAIADITFVILVPPSTVYYLSSSHWNLGNTVCKLINYFVYVTAYITVYTLVLISLIRFLTVVRGINISSSTTRRLVAASVAAIWILILVFNLPIYFECKVYLEHGYWVCSMENKYIEKMVFSTFFGLAYLLPLACIGLLSLGILRHIEKNKATSSAILPRNKKSNMKKRQTSRLLILVVVMFAISWFPTQVDLLYCALNGIPEGNIYSIFSIIFRTLAYSNSCVNPIIYNYTSRDFREAFKQALRRFCGCCGCLVGERSEQFEVATLATERVNVKKTEHRGIEMDTQNAVAEV